jgi:hypothetical protein
MREAALKETAAVAYGTTLPEWPFAGVADRIYRERILRARMMPPEEKLWAGEELFNYACAITLAGIRNQFPSYTESECRAELERRLAWRRKREACE